ncbi:MAG: aminotransferase class I/II-fold pyridoxal phosphate-dependent enzyme, partial [Chloroflexota bacterium]|nr:aminotransferase class I/II-fold pyridoxal phosphate-dependent enzyme [Chloroflexota bacterium]
SRLGPAVAPENIVLANGASDLLQLIVHAYVRPGDIVLIPTPTFNVYAVRSQLSQGQVVKVPLKGYTIDLAAVLGALGGARVVFICNPNNPTGTIVTHAELLEFLAHVPPEVLVVLDEAYMEFVDRPDFPRSLEYFSNGRQIIICRTLSKLYGLAGLRIGYGIAPAGLAARVREQKLTFHHGRLPLIAAAAALDDSDYEDRSREMVRSGRVFLREQFAALGLTCVPSEGNFVLLDDLPVSGDVLAAEALKRGVIVRDASSFGLPRAVRITVGRAEDNRRVLDVIREIILV